MTREEAIEYWEGLRKTFSSQLEKEENYFGRMHLQTTIDAVDMAISAIRQQDVADKHVWKNEPLTNAQKIQAMSDEELAEFIKHIKVRAALCKAVKNNDAFEALCSAEWLQHLAEEGDYEQ